MLINKIVLTLNNDKLNDTIMETSNNNTLGTITWAIEHARRAQKRAIDRISVNKHGVKYMHGLSRQTKFYVRLLTDASYGRRSAKNGYMLMTDKEYQYAIGMISADQLKQFDLSGKKMIVGVDVDLSGKLTLVPIR